MEAPLHQICGTRHWSTEPCPADKIAHSADTEGRARKPKPSADSVGGTGRPKAGVGSGATAAETAATPQGSKKRGRPTQDGQSTGTSKRAAYQRELMRKRRAANKT